LPGRSNPDPFARPVFRAPVYRTPAGIIALAQLARLLAWIIRMCVRHPVAATAAALLAFMWVSVGWIADAALVVWALLVLAVWRCYWPGSFTRYLAAPVRGKWRAWWCYRRRWEAVMNVADLAPWYRGRILMPVLGKVTATRYTDRVAVRLVSGQCADDFAKRADNLAHGFGALICRIRSAKSGAIVLEFVRRDALAQIIAALPVPGHPDLRALPVGRREDGLPWLVRLHGTHVLIAGATGAGKASLLWGLIRAMLPLMREGLVRVLAADPKLMELAYGRVIFDTHGHYAANPAAIAAMLEAAVDDMQDRAAQFAGRQRDHAPTRQHPFTVIVVDEVAFLTRTSALDNRASVAAVLGAPTGDAH
jgi:DNA segregation ATPase FtsK/SpoIIIE, S-DNA-T family